MKLCLLTNSKMLSSNTKLVFWNSSPKYPVKAVLVPNLKIFFRRTFLFEKIWGCWCKIQQCSSLFEFLPKNTQLKQFRSYTQKGIFPGNITFWRIRGADVKHDSSFCNFWPKSGQIRYFQWILVFSKTLST